MLFKVTCIRAANVEVKPQYRSSLKYSAASPEEAAKASFALEMDSSVRVYEVVDMDILRAHYIECGKQVYVKEVAPRIWLSLHWPPT